MAFKMTKIKILTALFLLLITIKLHAQTTYGPIQRGELLWHIAEKVKPAAHLNRYQVMIALLKANPHAFRVTCNINSLKVGAILNVPTLDKIEMLTQAAAITEFDRQKVEWQTFRKTRQAIICPDNINSTVAVKKLSPNEMLNAAVTEIEQKNTSQNEPNYGANLSVSEMLAREKEIQVEPEPVESLQPQPVVNTPVIMPLKTEVEQVNIAPTETTIQENIAALFTSLKNLPHFENIVIGGTLLLVFLLGWLLSNIGRGKENEPNNQPIKERIAHTLEEDMEAKLHLVRTYLSQGKTHKVHYLVKEIIAKGTLVQQDEALQLVEISRKINTLEADINQQHIDSQEKTTAPVLQKVKDLEEHTVLSKHYFPEDKDQIFGMIDKIFVLLDKELHAKGQLIDAYAERHQRQFFESDDYEVLNKSEKTEDNISKTRDDMKSTRYL